MTWLDWPRRFYSAFLGSGEARRARPSPPAPFGYKVGWIAVRAASAEAVVQVLTVRSPSEVGWEDGIEAAYRWQGTQSFVTPPVGGWVCIVGAWTMELGKDRSFGAVGTVAAALSARFGEAQGFASHRVVEYHHWLLARKGRVLRCFAYLGEADEVLRREGDVTEAERQIRDGSLPEEEWRPNEADVMTVAAGWSFDPTRLSAASGPPAAGILAEIVLP